MIGKALVFALIAVCLSGCASYKEYSLRLESADVEERRAAAEELRSISKRDEKLVPVLLKACGDPDEQVRIYALHALGKQDPSYPGVPRTILYAMKDTSLEIRRAGVSALATCNPFPNICLPELVKMLTDEDDMIRRFAETSFLNLGKLGISPLVRHLDSEDADTRLAIVMLLGKIGPEAKRALGHLVRLSREDEDLRVREAADRSVEFIR
ncbi:MAG: HEAT repeat domain-containing protein [Chitinispirillaceae bacterium]